MNTVHLQKCFALCFVEDSIPGEPFPVDVQLAVRVSPHHFNCSMLQLSVRMGASLPKVPVASLLKESTGGAFPWRAGVTIVVQAVDCLS